ncbi:MAG: ATP-binding protein [Candidatus Marsarchaeota archaeon]|jgi:predicted AAA+ superfamily ATPase|nr:ATP-binding protein [Candidatus Marsarchaeota archaeon]MCL5111280.1 ATP-binding protein [Candidatus Marsarchaeota archaeon]
MVTLTDLNRSNPWWSSGSGFGALDADLKGYNSQMIKVARRLPDMRAGSIYLIKGPRRAGKTVALKLFVQDLMENGARGGDILYYSFDGVRNQEELRNMLESFLGKVHKTTYLLLDEIQGVSGWEFVIKHLYDSGALGDSITVITGSIAHLLKREMLPGRGIEGNVYNMRTLSFNDFCITLAGAAINGAAADMFGSSTTKEALSSLLTTLKRTAIDMDDDINGIYAAASAAAPFSAALRKLFDLYMRTGGYPIAINDYFRNGGDGIGGNVADEIYNYLLNDAATLAGSALGDPAKARLVLKACMRNIGSIASYNKLAAYVDLNQKTFSSYAARLQNSYAMLTLNGVDKDLADLRAKKVYFADVFMHYAVGSKLDGEDVNAYYSKISNTEAIGTAVEEIVAGHLIRVREAEPITYESYLKFFRNASGREIDFIYKRSSASFVGIEVKYQNDASLKNDIYKIKSISEYILLTKDTLERGQNAIAMPVYIFLALLGKSEHDL